MSHENEGSIHHPADAPSLDALPRHIVTGFILPHITSSDWLNFRIASRTCYCLVHGSGAEDVSQSCCSICRPRARVGGDASDPSHDGTAITPSSDNDVLSDNLWKIALVREFQFEDGTNEEVRNWMYQSFHMPPYQPGDAMSGVLSTRNMFKASSIFMSWVHWRMIRRTMQMLDCRVQVNGPYFVRAGLIWRKIETWCDDAERSGSLGEAIKSTLLPGQVINFLDMGFDNARDSLDALRAVYSFYSGQNQSNRRYHPGEGLFGAFQVFNFVDASWWTMPLLRLGCIVIAESTWKEIFLDTETGQLASYSPSGIYSATPCAGGRFRRRGESGRIVEQLQNPSDGKDSLLRWFEEHADRLNQDHYAVGWLPTRRSRSHALLKFPSVADTVHCSRAVTCGVEVMASALFAEADEMVYICSIRVRILTPGDGEEYMSPNQRGFDTCQVMSEYWKTTRFTPGGPSIENEFRREGLTNGKYYPLLHEGGYKNFTHQVNDINGDDNIHKLELLEACDGTFAFQICARADGQGSIEGYFQCVPGSKDEPSGEMFNVMVAPFPLKYPQFRY